MRHCWSICILLGLISCQDNSNEQEPMFEKQQEIKTQVFNENIIVRQIEAKLSIPATENYSYTIYESEMNGDDSIDYIITVNQLEKAIDEAIQSGRVAKRAEVGYMGNFNHFFFVDGKTKEFSPAIPVPSSPHAQLKVEFVNIRSDAYYDITIDYRIRNSCFRRFFTVINGIPRQTFEAKIFDGLGTNEREAFVINYEKGTHSLAKDIIVYKGELEEIHLDDPDGHYVIDPDISTTWDLDRRWFFNQTDNKYYTEKN